MKPKRTYAAHMCEYLQWLSTTVTENETYFAATIYFLSWRQTLKYVSNDY